MNEQSSTMTEVNARVDSLGNPTYQFIETTDGHRSDPWGTVYFIGEVYYVVMGLNTVKLTW